MRDQLATALGSGHEAHEFTVAQVYGAGQFFIVDLPAHELVDKLVKLANDLGSPLFEARVLGQLDAITKIDGLDGTSEVGVTWHGADVACC